MTPRIVDTVPFNWARLNPGNPWYDRTTKKVVLPFAVKKQCNVVLTNDELKAYFEVLDAIRQTVTKEAVAVRAEHIARTKGQPSFTDTPRLTLLNHALQFMVTLVKAERATVKMVTEVAKRSKEGVMLP